ncbi:hypothetical protein, partial [Pseudomonas syringae]|uniref:hypothetical protein n=1 Tax=Pseudomonas syringae TaxID=317 RepID=UPI000516FCC8
VPPPAAGKGYLLIESSEGPLWWKEIDVPAEGKSFEIPLDKQWARHDLPRCQDSCRLSGFS